MKIWESVVLKRNREALNSKGNSSQRPAVAPEAKLRAYDLMSTYFYYDTLILPIAVICLST